MTIRDVVRAKYTAQLRFASELAVWCRNRAHELRDTDEAYRQHLLRSAAQADEAVRTISDDMSKLEDYETRVMCGLVPPAIAASKVTANARQQGA